MRVRSLMAVIAILLGGMSACGSDESPNDESRNTATEASTVTDGGSVTDQRFPDIVSAEAAVVKDRWTFTVTVSSPYDTPQRYADGWRIIGSDGTVYGEHSLDHDHASEQPFTRTQTDVVIPKAIDTVMVEGRDRANGYGGKKVTIRLNRP